MSFELCCALLNWISWLCWPFSLHCLTGSIQYYSIANSGKTPFTMFSVIDISFQIFTLLWTIRFVIFPRNELCVYTHLVHNKSHRILLYSYIGQCAACHRCDNYLCYTLAFQSSGKDKYHRKTRPVSVVAFVSVCRSYHTDVNKNPNLSSFLQDSLQPCREVETFFAVFFFFGRKANWSQQLKEGGKLLLKPFSCCLFGILIQPSVVCFSLSTTLMSSFQKTWPISRTFTDLYTR